MIEQRYFSDFLIISPPSTFRKVKENSTQTNQVFLLIIILLAKHISKFNSYSIYYLCINLYIIYETGNILIFN